MVTHVDQISTPPTPADPPTVFEERAAQVWSDLARAIPQLNQQADENNAAAIAADQARVRAIAEADAALSSRNEANAARAQALGHAGAAAQSSADAEASASNAAQYVGLAEAAAEAAESVVANAVQQTSSTGAALLPEGGDAQRPGSGSIPAGKLVIRGNTQDTADYKLEFWNRVAGAWQALASRVWVTLKIQELLDAATGFTIIYPNGGTSAAPANVAVNSRYVMASPFPGFAVITTVELRINGVWGDPKLVLGGNGSYGTGVSQNGDSIVVQTGQVAMCTSDAAQAGHGFGTLAGHVTAPVPCRVKVWKNKGAV